MRFQISCEFIFVLVSQVIVATCIYCHMQFAEPTTARKKVHEPGDVMPPPPPHSITDNGPTESQELEETICRGIIWSRPMPSNGDKTADNDDILVNCFLTVTMLSLH